MRLVGVAHRHIVTASRTFVGRSTEVVRNFKLLRRFSMLRNSTTTAAIVTTTNDTSSNNNNVAGMNALDFRERPVGVAKNNAPG